MPLYVVDDTEDNVDPEFDAMLFVVAGSPEKAAAYWEAEFERGMTQARVTLVPRVKTPAGPVSWGKVQQWIVSI